MTKLFPFSVLVQSENPKEIPDRHQGIRIHNKCRKIWKHYWIHGKLNNQIGRLYTGILDECLSLTIFLKYSDFLNSTKCREYLKTVNHNKCMSKSHLVDYNFTWGKHITLTVWRTSTVTAYCIFSIEARSTLLSSSFLFPSGPNAGWTWQLVSVHSPLQKYNKIFQEQELQEVTCTIPSIAVGFTGRYGFV